MAEPADSADDRRARARNARLRWHAANPNYRAEYNAKNRPRLLEQKREAEKKRLARVHADRDRRVKARERARQWATEHPEKARAQRQRYRERHPERVKATDRASYARHRDARTAAAREYRERNPERTAAAARRWQQENRQQLTAYQRDYRSQNVDVYERTLAANRDARRRDRRLKTLGLPAKRVRRTKVAERIRNDQAATAFFTRLRGPAERRRILAQYEPTPPELIAEWQQRSRLGKQRAAALERFPQRLEDYHAKHGERLREEVRMDSTARTLRGAEPLAIDDEVNRRALEAVWRATAGLGRPTPGTPRKSTDPSRRRRGTTPGPRDLGRDR